MNQEALALDAGHLALDFLNTVASPDGRHRDLLGAPGSFLTWLRATGLAAEADLGALRVSPPDVRLLLSDAMRLRGAVAEMVGACVARAEAPEPAVAEVNRILAARTVGLRLASGGEGHRLMSVPAAARPLALLAPVAEAAARLFVEEDPERVRRCADRGCGRWFLDASRNGRRRWCSMARCGNRAKAAAHYRRRRA